MNESRTHVGVIGGGIIGSWTALHLVEAGVRATLVEPFPPPDARGSSQGRSRAFRFLGDDEMDRLEYSFDRWQSLEREMGETLFVRTGLLNFGPEGDPFLAKHMAVVHDGGRPCSWLSSDAVRARFPLLRYPDEWGAAWDPGGGLLLADRCLAAVQRRFVQLGGTIVTARAASIESRSDGPVRIGLRSFATADVEPLDVERAVVCAGPWTARLLPGLSSVLDPLLAPVTYWMDPTGLHSVEHGFPILFNARLTGIYGLPSCEYPGLVKVLFHGGPATDPDAVDPRAVDPYVRQVADYVREHLPRLDHERPALVEPCFYTMTPDGNPILDRLDDGLVVGAGFSGSGFKHSPATGRMLAALALGREQDLTGGFVPARYGLERFAGGG